MYTKITQLSIGATEYSKPFKSVTCQVTGVYTVKYRDKSVRTIHLIQGIHYPLAIIGCTAVPTNGKLFGYEE